jgi:hypothetical protein
MHENYIEYIGHYGEDKLHLISSDRDKSMKNSKNLIYNMFGDYVKSNRLDSFCISNIHLKLKTDYSTYLFFQGFTNNILVVKEHDTHYIPRVWCNIKSRNLIKDHNNNTYNFEGQYYYDIIYNYIELGKNIINNIKQLPPNAITTEDKNNGTKLIKSFSNIIEYELILNFKEIYYLLQKYDNSVLSKEVYNIIYTIIDIINTIPSFPFRNTMKAFNHYDAIKNI